MSRYNRCKECYNMECVFVTGERDDFDSSECADFKPMTKADLVRNMTDEELAEFVAQQRFCAVSPMADKLGIDITQMFVKCRDIMLDWLRQEAT